jgi:hypothetical protein
MTIREAVKFALVKSNTSLTQVARLMSGTKAVSVQNLTRKINGGSLRYDDAVTIAGLLGYNIKWVKRGRNKSGGAWR